ncbi:hypothetical protein Lal_00041439, partial [Lupinus albus]
FATENIENPNRISYICCSRHGEKRDVKDYSHMHMKENNTNIRLISDVEKPLYDGCTKFMRLRAMPSLFGTLLNVSGKTKDDLNARLNLVSMRIRKELRPIIKEKHTYLSLRAYTLSMNEKIEFCKNFHNVKALKGYSFNIQNFVSTKNLKLKGLKSHDCHVLMEHLLSIGIRSILPKKCDEPKLSYAFSSRQFVTMVDPEKLHALPNDCIVERYIVEETLDFYTGYLADGDFIGIPKPRYAKITFGERITENQILTISRVKLEQTHLYVLHNVDEVESYVKRHRRCLGRLANGLSIRVVSYTDYLITSSNFIKKNQDDQSKMQNSGVTIVSRFLLISSVKERNPI